MTMTSDLRRQTGAVMTPADWWERERVHPLLSAAIQSNTDPYKDSVREQDTTHRKAAR